MEKWVFIFLLLFYAEARASFCHVVVDLDGVLLHYSKGEEGPYSITIQDTHYKIRKNAGYFLSALHALGCEISWFSAAPHSRNELFAEALRLPNGRAKEILTNLLSRKDISRDWGRETHSFFQLDSRISKGKKDLSKISGDLSSTVLVDDTPGNAMPGQEKNLLWVDPNKGDGELEYAFGLIVTALTHAEVRGVSLVEALWTLQWDENNPHKLTRSAHWNYFSSIGNHFMDNQSKIIEIQEHLCGLIISQ